jgi:ribonuclease Z
MGTGFVPLGNALLKENNPPKSAHVFISHFHWDHIIGYLGFTPFFLKDFICHIYGKQDKLSMEEIFERLHHYTFWPVEIPMYQAELNLNTFPEENGLKISDSVKISACKHGHPNGANSYRIELGDKIIVYSTDLEHPENHLNPNVIDIARDADVLIIDSQFTEDELPAHKGWGHSSWQQCVAVSKQANIKQLVLYHHSPANDDKAILKIEKDAQAEFPNTMAARQGMEIKLPA